MRNACQQATHSRKSVLTICVVQHAFRFEKLDDVMYNFVNAHQGLNSATVVKIDPCNLRFIQAVQVFEP